jgi:hypothetical protein
MAETRLTHDMMNASKLPQEQTPRNARPSKTLKPVYKNQGLPISYSVPMSTPKKMQYVLMPMEKRPRKKRPQEQGKTPRTGKDTLS